ncbi:MAG: class I SAM-dependent methyltransferase, partial [Deltaproteobacteria bacterium]|nr:class I SAM-dependent methyltransferase [Deltaproteobacteria bacterium]
MALSKNQIRDLYCDRAANYDLSANLYYLAGFRVAKYRNRAVSALRLKPGGTVVYIGCGTGLNFSYLLESIRQNGRVIGVDLTDAMLEKAKKRVRRNGWRNIELVHSDAATYEFPAKLQGVVSTFALSFVPEYKQVIKNAASALDSGGKLVVADHRKPDRWPLSLVKFSVMITKPFGVSFDLLKKKPWEAMAVYFPRVTV